MATDSKATNFDFTSLTLDGWLKDNDLSYIKVALSQHLGVLTLADVRVLSARDIHDFFDSLKAANDPLLDKMELKERIQFKRKILDLADAYSTHLEKNRKMVKRDTNNTKAGTSTENDTKLDTSNAGGKDSTSRKYENLSNEDATAMTKLEMNQQRTLEYLTLFENDIKELTNEFEKCNYKLGREFEKIISVVTKVRDELKDKVNRIYQERMTLLHTQTNVLRKHLQSVEQCQKKCEKLIDSANNNSEITKLCNECVELSPNGLYEIPYKIELTNLNQYKRGVSSFAAYYELKLRALFSKLNFVDITKDTLKSIDLTGNDSAAVTTGDGNNVDDDSKDNNEKKTGKEGSGKTLDELSKTEEIEWRKNLTKGSKLNCFDVNRQKWLPGQVIDVDNNSGKLLIHFDGFDKKFDSLCDRDSKYLSPYSVAKEEQSKKEEEISGVPLDQLNLQLDSDVDDEF